MKRFKVTMTDESGDAKYSGIFAKPNHEQFHPGDRITIQCENEEHAVVWITIERTE